MIFGKSLVRIVSFAVLLILVVGLPLISSGDSEGDSAIKGYDPVAYFTRERAVKGDAAFTFRWHGMTWFFTSEENRVLFIASPEAYAPQYDGYCAWAMTESRKAITDPEVWKIFNGKLYLNCSKEAYGKWSRDIPGNIDKADRNWLKLTGEAEEGNP